MATKQKVIVLPSNDEIILHMFVSFNRLVYYTIEMHSYILFTIQHITRVYIHAVTHGIPVMTSGAPFTKHELT